jgi:hypothetical protein
MMATRPYDDVVGFRLDWEPSAGVAGPEAHTLAIDYDPLPLAFLEVALARGNPEAALDILAPRLRTAAGIARPRIVREHAGAGDATLRLHAAIVRAPLLAKERTSAAEIAGQLSGWREIATFGWRDQPGENARRSAYELLGRLHIGR